MRSFFASAASAAAAAVLLAAIPCRAEDRDPAGAFFVGAAVIVAGFTAGGLVVATANRGSVQDNAGWLTIESGFALAPVVSHALVDSWGRGFAYAAVPAGVIAGTLGLFAYDPGTIAHGSLPEQRWLWGMFVASLASGTAGVVDVLLLGPRDRGIALVPSLGAGQVGLTVRGPL